VAASWIIEAIDVLKGCHLSLPAGFPCIAPDQFRLDGFEERFDGGVVIAIALAAHGHAEAVLAQDFSIVVRTILAATVRMMDTAFRRCPEGNGHVQSSDRQVPLHPVAHRPTIT
jgi:hypothetical protein